MKRSILIQVIAAALIFLFVYAAMSKLLAYPLFVAQLHTHPYLKHFARFIAWTVPVTESGIGLLLLFPLTRMAGLYSSLFLLLIFTSYIILMLLSGRSLPCSCGGVIGTLTWRQHLIFNGVFILISLSGIILEMKHRKKTLLQQKPLPGIRAAGRN